MFLIPALDDLVPKGLPYAIRGAIIRGIRGVISSVASFAVVGIGNGTILAPLHLSPEISVIIAATLTPTILAVDKYLRERGYEEDSTTDPIPPEPTPPLPPKPPVVIPAPTSDGGIDLGPASDTEPPTDEGPVDGSVTE